MAYLKRQSPEWKAKIVDIAIGLENKTASLRRDDDLICRGGMAEYAAALARGTQQQMPSADSRIRIIDVRAPADWQPKFVAPEVYKPLQEKARRDARADLLKLIE